jgi:hypothetical protein
MIILPTLLPAGPLADENQAGYLAKGLVITRISARNARLSSRSDGSEFSRGLMVCEK